MMLRLAILALFAVFASAIPAHAWLFRTVGGGQIAPSGPTITFNPSSPNYVYPSGPGSTIEALTATLSAGSFSPSGSFTLSGDAGCADLSISGYNLVVGASNLSGSPTCHVLANYPGASNTPVSALVSLAGTQQTIASIAPLSYSFVAPSTVGNALGTPTVTMSGGISFSAGGGTLALGTGSNCSDFQLPSGSLQNATSGLAAGTYNCSFVATDSNALNSPQTPSFSVTGNPAGITMVQDPAPTSCSGASCVVSMTGLGSGHLVTLGVPWCTGPGCGQQYQTITGITDTNGNTCTAAPNTLYNIDPETQIWACPVNNSGNDTFTVNFSTTVYNAAVYPREWAGASVAAPIDVGSFGSGGGSAASLTVTSSVPGDLIYSIGNFYYGGTVTPGQTALAANGWDEYQNVGAPGAYSNTWTMSGAGWGASILALKPVAITGIALSANSYTAGQPTNTVIGSITTTLNPASPGFSGTDAVVSTGTDYQGNPCNASGTSNFKAVNVSGTWELELNGTGATGAQTFICVASSQSGIATAVYSFTLTGITQTLTAPVLSSNTFTPNTPSGVVGTVAEIPSPMNPPAVVTLAITGGANSGNFQLVGSGCTSTTGTCSLEQPSSGGTPAGTYSDITITATGSYPNSPQSINPTVVSPPANTIMVSDASGLGATNYPVGAGRPFNPGAIPAGSCAQVTYEGSQLQTQADVENYYPDGSWKWAEISVLLPSIPAAAKLPTSAAGSGNVLSFAGLLPSWVANGLGVTDADFANKIPSGVTIASFVSSSGTSTVTLTGTNSANLVGNGDYIQFGTETLSIAPVSGGSYSGSHVTATAGSCATSTPLSVSAMLANYNFDSNITYSGGVSPSGSSTISARAMLTDAATCSSTDPMSSIAKCRLFYYGPVRNTIWLADNTETSTCPSGSANGAGKWDVGFGNGFCPVRPEFLATFWPGIPQAHVRAVSAMGMYNAYQDVGYVATVTAGNTSPTTLPGFPLDLTGTGNGLGQGITGLTVNQTVNSSYTGNLTVAGTPSTALTVGQWYNIYDNNTGEWIQATYNSATQIAVYQRGSGFGYPTNNLTVGDVLTVAPLTFNFGYNTSNSAVKRQWHGSDWTVRAWIGTAPNQEINIDNNLAYLEWTHYITNMDPSIRVPEAVLEGTNAGCDQATITPGHYYGYTGWYSNCTNLPYDGDWNGGVYAMDMGTYGGRPEIGIQPQWASQWLNTGDWRMRVTSEARADNFSNWEFHLIQTSPSAQILRYDTAGTGFGLPATTQGNPGIVTTFGDWPWYSQDAGYGASVPTVTGAFNSGGPWSEMVGSHAPEVYYVPYIVTGDPFYLGEMGQWTTYVAAQNHDATLSYNDAGASGPLDNNGKGTYTAALAALTESRYAAWDIRNFAETANAWPDGDKYQTYFISGANDILAALAGAFQIGASSPYYGTKMYDWAAGIGSGSVTSGPSGFCSAAGQSAPSPIGDVGCITPPFDVGDCEAQGAKADETLYQSYFVTDAALAADVGFPKDVSQWAGKLPIGFYTSPYPELYPTLSQGFNVTDNSNTFFPTMAAIINNFTSAPNGISYLTNSPPYTGYCNNATSVPADWYTEFHPWQQVTYGMPGLAMQVDEGTAGANTAWAWMNTNYMQIMNTLPPNPADNQVGWAFDTTWDVIPRSPGDQAPLWSFDPTIQ